MIYAQGVKYSSLTLLSFVLLLNSTMTFGLESTSLSTSAVRVRGTKEIKLFLDKFHAYGHVELDTARIYCNGDTELVSLDFDLGQEP